MNFESSPSFPTQHALGYHHMHNHIDRDRYVQIIWGNIAESKRHNFDRVDPEKFGNFGTPYDLLSIMHYSRGAFGDGRDTIVPHDRNFLNVIGNRDSLSSGDIARIRNMYQC